MRVEHVAVYSDKVRFRLRLEGDEPRKTTQVPGLTEQVLDLLPGLAAHRCTGSDELFGSEVGCTEVAHLFEHVVLEYMLLAGEGTRLDGTTAWDVAKTGRGVYHVTVEYSDDLVCLAASKAAMRVMDYLLEEGPMPDVRAEVEELRRLADRGPERA